MKILTMNISVDKVPDSCCATGINSDGCIFNQNKYCVLRMALGLPGTFVQNFREDIPDDCPLNKEIEA